MSTTPPTFYPTLRYEDAPAAIEWLEQALGFVRQFVVDGPQGTIAHAQLTYGEGMVMLGSSTNQGIPDATPGVQSIYAYCADPDALCERASAAGAEVLRDPHDTDYGSREMSVRDPGGHIWSFGTYRPAAEDRPS